MTTRRRACRTGKRGWHSAEQAKKAITWTKQQGEVRAKMPVRTYRCEFCHQFHLTSQAS